MSELTDMNSGQNADHSTILETMHKQSSNANIRQHINSTSSSSSIKESSSSSSSLSQKVMTFVQLKTKFPLCFFVCLCYQVLNSSSTSSTTKSSTTTSRVAKSSTQRQILSSSSSSSKAIAIQRDLSDMKNSMSEMSTLTLENSGSPLYKR